MFPSIPKTKQTTMGDSCYEVNKRVPLQSYNHTVFNYESDRLVASRRLTNSEFLKEPNIEYFDLANYHNDQKFLKRMHYESTLRKQYQDDFQKTKKVKLETALKKRAENVPLLHFDWTCKVESLRPKFYPDFETLKKPDTGKIHTYVWSKRQILAAVSKRKISLYHPFNGFTRALDVFGSVSIAFDNEGTRLAMAYREDITAQPRTPDIFIFEIDEHILFEYEELNTLKITSNSPEPITSICFTPKREGILIGLEGGNVMLIKLKNEFEIPPSAQTKFCYEMISEEIYRSEIIKMSFSCNGNYLATLNGLGHVSVYEWSSKVQIYNSNCDAQMYKIKHLEWHPYVNDELLVGSVVKSALYLINTKEKKVVASYESTVNQIELTSVSFNPKNGQVAVNFWIPSQDMNRVCVLASMNETLNSYVFDNYDGPLKVFWNSTGTMLGAGAECFRFAFWSYHPNGDFKIPIIKDSAKNKNPTLITTLNDTKLSSLR